MENRSSADDVDDVAKDYSGDGIQEHDFAEEFSSDLPSLAMSLSAPSGSSSPHSSLQVPSTPKVDDHDGRDVAHVGSVSDTKKLEHALQSEPMQLPAGLGMEYSLERSPVVHASNYDVSPGAYRVRSAGNTVTSRTFRSPIRSYDSPSEFTNEESEQEEGVSNSAAAGSGLYTVEAQRVPDGNEDGTVMVAEAQYVRTKWYQRRWITFGSILCACGLVVVVVVLVVRQPSAATSSSSLMSPTSVPITGAPTILSPTTAPPTTAPITDAPATPDPTAAAPTRAPVTRWPTTTAKPTSLTPVEIACKFLSIPNVTKCRSTFEFSSVDTTTGSAIPSEIGLLTQLTFLYFSNNALTSTIPSEIGLLTQLTLLYFSDNALTSTIPSEIGLLTILMHLSFSSNVLISTIPSEIGLLTRLTELSFSNNQLMGTIPSSLCSLTMQINIDCGEITCASGCCMSDWGGPSCG